MSRAPAYAYKVFYSLDDRAFVAHVPDLPGCCAVGPTPDAAAREIPEAVRAWISACEAAGNPVPASSATAAGAPVREGEG